MAGKKVSDRRITLAGRKIRKILYRTTPNISVTKWALDHGVRRVDVYRIINGERWRHISVDVAVKISEGSRGYIQVADFMSETAVAIEEAEKEEPLGFGRTGTWG